SLVEKLLNFTTLEDLKEQDVERREVPVDGVLADAHEALKSWIEERKAAIELKSAPGLAVSGDRLLLRDVFKNLIENGVKFSEAGRKIEIWAELAGPEIAVHVRDQGPGIPPEEQSKVFDKFYQIEASFTGQVDGWGLGLPFVKKVVETHGGRVKLESSLGQGTTVTLFLPKSAAAEPEKAAAS
ncbi:MAG: HAMP domain-containing histidine kinase, partial [Elusimicrobia bacterium]|nr:HAMP domain-containing histidine kinase [Elusimicrobiota bacterium]